MQSFLTRMFAVCILATFLTGCARRKHQDALEGSLAEVSMAAAHASQRLGEIGRSQKLLEVTPTSGRNRVWRHLRAVSDDSDDAWNAHAGTVYAIADDASLSAFDRGSAQLAVLGHVAPPTAAQKKP